MTFINLTLSTFLFRFRISMKMTLNYIFFFSWKLKIKYSNWIDLIILFIHLIFCDIFDHWENTWCIYSISNQPYIFLLYICHNYIYYKNTKLVLYTNLAQHVYLKSGYTSSNMIVYRCIVSLKSIFYIIRNAKRWIGGLRA